jgi:hypothetical protein
MNTTVSPVIICIENLRTYIVTYIPTAKQRLYKQALTIERFFLWDPRSDRYCAMAR